MGGGGKGRDRLRDILATGEWESQGILNICHRGRRRRGGGGVNGRSVRQKKLGLTDTLGKRGTLEGGVRWRERSEERPRRMDMN